MPIGQTPLVSVAGIFAKLECTNPCGSIKDRIASYILRKSVESGQLRPGTRIIEATSGNTGIALSYFAREMHFPITIVMPENMTDERKRIMRDFGAELILCSQEGSFAEAAQIRDRLARERGYFNTDQFSNPLNVECHFATTGTEIVQQMEALHAGQRIDAFVAGIGTGGTLIGVGQRLREAYDGVRIVAVEPAESPVLSGGKPGLHGINGIGDGFIPAIAGDGRGGLNPLIDEVICVSTAEAMEAARRLNERHGYCVGVSSGANLVAAQKLLAAGHRTVVTVFADGYAKYQSVGLRHCASGSCPFEHEPLIQRSLRG